MKLLHHELREPTIASYFGTPVTTPNIDVKLVSEYTCATTLVKWEVKPLGVISTFELWYGVTL